ncbi:MAG: hypothetical protein KJ896_00980 [Nanoarchaeota archaeon]|nr:hypothetical protein [Nanoarchaeota archaeon]
MDMKEFNNKVNALFADLQEKISYIAHFVVSRLKNYKNITLGEQIAYPCIGSGMLLIFVSIILFII